MIAIPISLVQDVQKQFRAKIDKQRDDAIQALDLLLQNTSDLPDQIFVKNILDLYMREIDLLVLTPDKFDDLKLEIGQVPQVPSTQKNKPGDVPSPIKDKIIKALGYKELRNTFYPGYFGQIGIKSCIYCNSQLTVSVKLKGNEFSARFDVDHYHSKDAFPWMSIFLFNLYPSCASCNRRKSNNAVEFDLYSADASAQAKSGYTFKLTPLSKAKYLISKDPKDLNFTFEEPIYKLTDVKTFQETFNITGIYHTQLDVIEEIFAKSQMYDDTYRNVLSTNFSKLGIDPTIYKRLILGNYTEEHEMHKRPMSKFMQDIAKDLGLLDD